MRTVTMMLLALAAVPAQAEPMQGRGYFTGCVSDSCEIVVGTVFTYVEGGAGTSVDLMLQMYEMDEGVAAVEFSGDYVGRGDGFADMVLQDMQVIADDPIAASLTLLQGRLRPMGAASELSIRIKGLRWNEGMPGRPEETWFIRPAMACPDGSAPGGMVLTLVPSGEEADRPGCWQIESSSDFDLTLREVSGAAKPLRLSRIGS